MFNGINIRNHNRQQLQKASQFLQKNNALNNIPHPTIQQQNQSEDNCSLWAEIQLMAQIAKQNKNKFNVQNISNYKRQITNQRSISYNTNFQQNKQNKSEYTNSQYSQLKTEFSENLANYNSKQQRVSERLNHYMNKSHLFKQQQQKYLADQSKTQNQKIHIYKQKKYEKNQKEKKEKRKNKQNRILKQQQDHALENIIQQRNPNLFTIDKLKIAQPLVRNYRIGNRLQWEKNNKIQDYKLQFVLRKFQKIKDYRNNQKAIIKCSLLGNDVFVCMPTGGGKSLTFQAMTFIQKGVYLCILPLVSLIIDQQQQAKKIGIRAYSLTGSKQIQDNKMIYQQLINYQRGAQSIVVFCTPEKVNKSPQFFNVLQQVYQNKCLVKIVIDEVHCVSTWGKQFRQDYQNLSSLRQKFPKTPILGLTATVTQIIKQDIIKRLGIQNCYYFQSSFNRPNLYYQVRQKNKDILNNIIKIINEYENQSGIIYCVSRKDCQDMCTQLQSRKYKVAFYHANINENDKRQIQYQWMQNKIQIIIATIAFGMGINKPDVRFVIHHSLSKSLQNYYQESGRAGRDGQDAKCILFYRKGDKISLQSLIMKNQISKDDNKNFCMKQLSNIIRYCQDKFTCRRKFQLQYLGEKDFNTSQCNKTCDNCKRGLQYFEVQCIKQAKFLINFMISIQRSKQNISQNQIIMLCKGKNQKQFKYKAQQIERIFDLSQLRQMFNKWNKNSIDQLITQLSSFQIFYQKIFTTNTFKNNVVSNIYLKVNFSIANKFLQKVQTLPMKRNLTNKKNINKQNNVTDISDVQFDFQQQFKNDDEHNEQKFQQMKYYFKGNTE